MATVKVLLNKYRVLQDGTYPLVFQIIHNRRKKLIYSGFRVYEETFNSSLNLIVNRRRRRVSNRDAINKHIEETLKALHLAIGVLNARAESFEVSDIVEVYRSNLDDCYVLTYLRRLITQIEREGRLGTSGAYRSTLNCLQRYLKSAENLRFENITIRWLNDFISYLRHNNLKPNTINFYIRILRAIYNRARKEDIFGIYTESPFHLVHISYVHTAKRAISKDVMMKIALAHFFEDKRVEYARDLFLFSFYSRGMPFVDMAFLKHCNITEDILCYNRHKTGQPIRVMIIEDLQLLIDKYRNGSEYVLPILTSGGNNLYAEYKKALRSYNLQLANLSTKLKLPIPLTSYVARHSWATIARNSGIPVSVISEGLGHSSEKITYAYLAGLDPLLLNNANKMVANFSPVKSMKK